MIRRALAIGATILVTSVAAQDKPASRALVSKEEREPFIQALLQSAEFKKFAERRERTKMPLCQMLLLPASKGKPEVVETLHFKYDEGVTLRTRIDAPNKILLRIEKLRAYPTPLAAEELERAIELAKGESQAIAKLFEDAGERVDVTSLVPVESDAMSPRFGHRLVLLSVGSMPPDDQNPSRLKRVTVEVDLTNETVSDPV